ncbi:MAG TPA: GNAT family N-acetyltransferase [Caulobacterales bacterium]|nr:GNAT family N-acetyltransferase [Caulobacterales bacterium]
MAVREAPPIETERLLLRAYRIEDFPIYVTAWADPRTVRYISGRTFTEEESWGRFLRNIALWPMLGFGYWAIEEKSSGRYVGDIGFADFKREMEPSVQGIPEMGWVLAPETHGRGYATEAGRAALAWGESQWGSKRVVCMIDPDNEPSLNVARKLGFTPVLNTHYKDFPTILLTRG